MHFSPAPLAVLAALTVCLPLAGCAPDDASLPREVTTAIENAFASNDPVALAAQFADDAELLQPNAPIIRGREAIDEFWKEQVRFVLSYDMNTIESRVFGDYAWHYANYSFRNVTLGNIVESGKVIEIWKRVDGTWKVYRTSWSLDRLPPAVVEPAEVS